MHAFIRGRIRARLSSHFAETGRDMRILYGGSVRRSNAKQLLTVENVDGALVGGASLDAAEFLAIAGIYREL
jgi:triosephosphate isomerase